MNSENSKISDSHRILLNISDKTKFMLNMKKHKEVIQKQEM